MTKNSAFKTKNTRVATQKKKLKISSFKNPSSFDIKETTGTYMIQIEVRDRKPGENSNFTNLMSYSLEAYF